MMCVLIGVACQPWALTTRLYDCHICARVFVEYPMNNPELDSQTKWLPVRHAKLVVVAQEFVSLRNVAQCIVFLAIS